MINSVKKHLHSAWKVYKLQTRIFTVCAANIQRYMGIIRHITNEKYLYTSLKNRNTSAQDFKSSQKTQELDLRPQVGAGVLKIPFTDYEPGTVAETSQMMPPNPFG